ncbi:MAG: (d)CMP kinase [Planctomycetota bacterium]
MIIAIDGPAGSGKSTVAMRLAQRLGFLMLNTGAMYRAVGVAAHEAGIDLDDGPACARLAAELALDVDDEGRLLAWAGDRHGWPPGRRTRGLGQPRCVATRSTHGAGDRAAGHRPAGMIW